MGNVPAWAYVVGFPLWAWLGIGFARAIRESPNLWARWNERARDVAAEKAGDWSRLRDEVGRLSARVKHLEERCETYEADLIECHRERDDERAGRLRAEAVLQGQGEVKQMAAGIVAGDRLARRAEEGNGGE